MQSALPKRCMGMRSMKTQSLDVPSSFPFSFFPEYTYNLATHKSAISSNLIKIRKSRHYANVAKADR